MRSNINPLLFCIYFFCNFFAFSHFSFFLAGKRKLQCELLGVDLQLWRRCQDESFHPTGDKKHQGQLFVVCPIDNHHNLSPLWFLVVVYSVYSKLFTSLEYFEMFLLFMDFIILGDTCILNPGMWQRALWASVEPMCRMFPNVWWGKFKGQVHNAGCATNWTKELWLIALLLFLLSDFLKIPLWLVIG